MNFRDGRLVLIALALLVAGCSSLVQRDQMARFNTAYGGGQYVMAAESMQVEADSSDEPQSPMADSGQYVLEWLHQGEAYRLAGEFDQSVQAFDRAEASMKYLDTESTLANFAGDVASVILNDSSRDYRALMSEGILVNTYKGLDFLALGNADNARVEFNRADDRTRRAVDYFSDDIRSEQQRLQEDNTNAQLVNRTLDSRDLQKALNESYGNPSSWSVYPEYIVPASTYLHGLYFLAASTGGSDTEKALTSLHRVAGMTPDNATLAGDVELAEALSSGRQSRRDLPPQVWVMYENGLGPVLEEIRFDVPLFISRHGESQVIFAVVALPRYRDRTAVPGELTVLAGNEQSVSTEAVANMGKVIRTEMQDRFTGVLIRAVSSSVIKAFIQSQAAESMGPLGQFGAILYTVSTTQADLRGWQAMPDHWSVARLDRPEDGRVTLVDSGQGTLGELDLPPWPFTLVYVKRPTAEGPATVMVLDLQGQNRGQYYSLQRPGNPEK